MIHFLLLISRQGKVRLSKWYETYAAKEKAKVVREVTAAVLDRHQKLCNILEWKDGKIVYKRSDLATYSDILTQHSKDTLHCTLSSSLTRMTTN